MYSYTHDEQSLYYINISFNYVAFIAYNFNLKLNVDKCISCTI